MTPNQYFTRIAAVVTIIIIALVFAYFNSPNSSKKMTNIDNNPRDYQVVLDKANSVKEGQTREEVMALMGEPTSKNDQAWEYDLDGLDNRPKLEPGNQVFYGVQVIFDQEGKVASTSFSWADKE